MGQFSAGAHLHQVTALNRHVLTALIAAGAGGAEAGGMPGGMPGSAPGSGAPGGGPTVEEVD